MRAGVQVVTGSATSRRPSLLGTAHTWAVFPAEAAFTAKGEAASAAKPTSIDALPWTH